MNSSKTELLLENLLLTKLNEMLISSLFKLKPELANNALDDFCQFCGQLEREAETEQEEQQIGRVADQVYEHLVALYIALEEQANNTPH